MPLLAIQIPSAIGNAKAFLDYDHCRIWIKTPISSTLCTTPALAFFDGGEISAMIFADFCDSTGLFHFTFVEANLTICSL